MAYDFVKENKEYYKKSFIPKVLELKNVRYLAINGKGNPNDSNGEFNQKISILYNAIYDVKMSYKKEDYKIDNFHEFKVSPLEGYWWMDDIDGIDYRTKEKFNWIIMLRIPDFFTGELLERVKANILKKKKIDGKDLYIRCDNEGLVVQILHKGSFDDEPRSVEIMDTFLVENGYVNDFNDERIHKEIYLTDSRKCSSDNSLTIIRHPIKKTNN